MSILEILSQDTATLFIKYELLLHESKKHDVYVATNFCLNETCFLLMQGDDLSL